jgi:hypothetical protein
VRPPTRASARSKDGEIQFLRERLVQEHDECRAAQVKLEEGQVRLAELVATRHEISRFRQDNEVLRYRISKTEHDACSSERPLSASLSEAEMRNAEVHTG